MMGFSLNESVPVITIFVQGLVSFFSPCVLPLIPIYIGYLSGGTRKTDEEGRVYFSRKKVMVNTVFFIIGVSFTFFLLGFGASLVGNFFKGSQNLFVKIGGILIVLFGLYELGVFGQSKVLSREHRLPFHPDRLAMSPITALIMGFMFSFAWTPCVGPALSSVLLMTASAGTKVWAFVLIGVYTLGFVLPFLAVGIFSSTMLDLFKKHANVVRYTVKLGGILMILMGIMMFTGKLNAVTGYLSKPPTVEKTGSGKEEKEGNAAQKDKNADKQKIETSKPKEDESSKKKEENKELPDALDFELEDQFGNVHTLEDYKGKVIFMNFWATWCPPCRRELPEIQKLYEKYSAEEEPEVVILGVAAPSYGREQNKDGIIKFLEDNGYTYPVLMDENTKLFEGYQIGSFPTTFMITKEGKIFGSISGQLSEDIMQRIIDQTLAGKTK